MVKWNSGFMFNRAGNELGFVWNSDIYLIILNMSEVIKADDTISERLATFVLNEKPLKVYDELLMAALYTQNDRETISMQEDKLDVSLAFFLTEKLGIKDEFTDLIVLAFLHDKIEVVEQAKTFAQLVATDQIKAKDISTVLALYDVLDQFNLKDLRAAMETIVNTHDRIGLTDHDPRMAISDFLIGHVDDYDTAFDYFVPFGMRVDWNNTKIQVMPEAELTKIEMPGVDGSIVEDSVYKDRMFEIMAFSAPNLTIHQKEKLKAQITRILDSTKHQSKKLTVQANGVMFDVRYEGEAEVAPNTPSYVKAKIPLHVSPYGKKLFPEELYGSGLVDNTDGDAPLRVKHTISGPITNPKFSLGTITYTWNGTVPYGSKLVIDHECYTCYLIDTNNVKKNALSKLTGEFMAIPVGESVVLNAMGETASKMLTEWQVKVLW